MISYSTGVRQVVVGATIRAENRAVLGMIGGAIPWEEIEVRINAIRDRILADFGSTVRIALIDADGIYVYHWEPEKVVHLELDDAGRPVLNAIGERSVVLHRITEDAIGELAEAGARMIRGEAGQRFFTDPESDERQAVVYAPVTSARYTIAMVLPERVIMAPVARLERLFAIVLVTTVGLGAIVAVVLAARMSRRVVVLSDAAGRIAKGNLETRVELTGRDEIQQLGSAFNRMAEDLGHHVRRLGEEQAARARIEHDLEIARGIQRGLLPKEQLSMAGFEVAGWNQPAQETGGDYYDWQQLPDGRWVVSVADVTGHGIGPALVTAFCRAYSRATLSGTAELDRCVNRINELMHADLPEGRFVTFVVALLDADRGTVELLSAGHGPLLLHLAAQNRVESFTAHDIPLGLMNDVGYGPSQQIRLEKGDVLVLLTDGFFEWANPEGEQFGTQRLAEAIKKAAGGSSKQIIADLHASVRDFVGDVQQPDDLTAVVIKRTAASTAATAAR
jgi:serine phosphatase RsbU (regulator of sigma subunit)